MPAFARPRFPGLVGTKDRTRPAGAIPAGLVAALTASLLLVGGCATGSGDRGDGLAGRTIRMQTVRGDVTTLRFRSDGTVRAEFRGRSLTGRWRLRDRRLCFDWAGAPRECWPWRHPLERGERRSITSDRGNVLRVTML